VSESLVRFVANACHLHLDLDSKGHCGILHPCPLVCTS
jgi:hypothetical protein